MTAAADDSPDPRQLYLDLMKSCLTRQLFDDYYAPVKAEHPVKKRVVRVAERVFATADIELVRRVPLNRDRRTIGRDHPVDAETMIGTLRLDNIEHCVKQVIKDGVPGDLIETGVWRGGATIFMRSILKAYGVRDRKVWVADSFRGLPKPNEQKYAADRGDTHWKRTHLGISREQVERNFERYGLLDDQVRFLVGWFSETLATAPIESIAVARLDGDMYESTMDALVALYPKVSVGGYVIVDDYGAVPGCKQAVHDYRREHNIEDGIEEIDWTGVFWRKSGSSPT